MKEDLRLGSLVAVLLAALLGLYWWWPSLARLLPQPPAQVAAWAPAHLPEGAMASYRVSGAGDASYNGAYAEDGAVNGKPKYTNGTCWLYWDSGEVYWYLDTDTTGMPAYYATGPDLPGTGWTAATGTPPAPTVIETTGGWVEGHVLDVDGAALQGATVTATDGETTSVGVTDANGFYQTSANLPAGDYEVTCAGSDDPLGALYGWTFRPASRTVTCAAAAVDVDFWGTAEGSGGEIIATGLASAYHGVPPDDYLTTGGAIEVTGGARSGKKDPGGIIVILGGAVRGDTVPPANLAVLAEYYRRCA